MPVTRHPDGTVVVTGDDTKNVQLLMLKQALALELRGIRLPRNVQTMRTARRLGYAQRTRRQVYAAVARDVELMLTQPGGTC